MGGRATKNQRRAEGNIKGGVANALTNRGGDNKPKPIKNAVGCQPVPVGYRKVKNAVSG